MGRYDEVYRRSIDDPESFWSEAAGAIRWWKRNTCGGGTFTMGKSNERIWRWNGSL